jgi:hypothetical protein
MYDAIFDTHLSKGIHALEAAHEPIPAHLE